MEQGPPDRLVCPYLTGCRTVDAHQEIPLHLQLADLLQAGDQAVVVPGLLLLAVAEDAGGVLRKSLLPSLNLPGINFIPGG